LSAVLTTNNQAAAFHNQPSRFTAWRLFVSLGIVVATTLWAISNIKNSSRIDGPRGRGYSASRAGGFCFAPAQLDLWREMANYVASHPHP
jgi:hypothetical protein